MPVKRQPRILIVLAHPDDETLVSGTIALNIHAGASVCLVCATNGGGGLAPAETSEKELSEMRKESLKQACAILGVQRLELLESRIQLDHSLNRTNYAAVIDKHRQWVMELLDDFLPDTVITFGPEGLTGHATHIMVGLLTTQAVLLSKRRRLYYLAFSKAEVSGILNWFLKNPAVTRQYAEEVRRKPNLGAESPVLYPVSDTIITTRVDIADVIDVKRRAWQCHCTQGGGGRVLDAFGANLTESFVRVLPRPEPHEPIEDQL